MTWAVIVSGQGVRTGADWHDVPTYGSRTERHGPPPDGFHRGVEFLGLAHELSDVAYHQIVTGNSAKDDHENGRGKRAVLEQIGALAPTIYVQGSAEDGLASELSTLQR